MTGAKKITQAFLLLFSIFIITVICLAESLHDGAIFREEGPVYLKNGEVIECKRFWWFVLTADYVQCDKGDRADKIMINDIDIKKTFGDAIAKEYAELKVELDQRHTERKEERESNKLVISPSETKGENFSEEGGPSAEAESTTEVEEAEEETESIESTETIDQLSGTSESGRESAPAQNRDSGTRVETSSAKTKKEIEKELSNLKSQMQAVQKQIESIENIINEAKPRLEKLPHYSETLKRQQELMAQRAKAEKEGKPTDTLTSGIIESGKELEKIMRKDAEVSKAMDNLIELSSKETDLESQINDLQQQYRELQETAGSERNK